MRIAIGQCSRGNKVYCVSRSPRVQNVYGDNLYTIYTIGLYTGHPSTVRHTHPICLSIVRQDNSTEWILFILWQVSPRTESLVRRSIYNINNQYMYWSPKYKYQYSIYTSIVRQDNTNNEYNLYYNGRSPCVQNVR